MPGVAAEAVEFPDNQHIALTDILEKRVEPRAAGKWSEDAFIGENFGDAGRGVRITLHPGGLIIGADSYIAN